ncbi:SAM-dependent methyltransferase [Streptomyces pactum]|uniref:SAM-dependent methyltransferase n=1 Tax=Streptomyces pactum TaxID=68249 RepID=UPI001E2B618B|nr:SAM-dependent methyltransferase [Streptomyces pactum]
MVSETPGWRGWRAATEAALYGPDGFFRRPEGPAGHFRTSVHASPRYAEAVAELLRRVDAALGHPGELALVDIGAGRGELLTGVLAVLDRAAPPGGTGRETAAHGPDATATGRPPGAGRDSTGTGRGATGTGDAATPAITGVGDAGGTGPVPPLRERLRPYAVERAARPDGLDPRITWTGTPPTGVRGLLFANEWLDNVPVEVAETDPDGVPRQVLVAADGAERLGTPVAGPDARWLERWWPVAGEPGARAEIGRPRDLAWAAAVRCLRAGLAVAVDYAHTRDTRPPFGTLTGYREGREVRPVPDGGCDITAHVALDACAAAGGPGLHRPGGIRACAGRGR